MSTANHVVVEHLVKRFQDKVVVDNLSLEIGAGELFVLVGPSGCGKTTTLRLIAGLEAVTSGRILFNDHLVNDIRPSERNVAMVFQDYAIFPHMTVFENIAYGLRSRHVQRSVINQRVPDAAKMFRIDSLLKRKPRQLSGGERQRVALARSVVREASIYLFDEPLANLDAQLRHQAREDILLLHREKGQPAIYVTHDQSEAMALGDRIGVMRDGQIQQIGTGTELYEQPCNQFVAFFIGTPSINIFEVELQSSDDGVSLVHSAFSLALPAEFEEKVKEHIGQKVNLGLRPENLQSPRTASFPVSEENTLRGIVNVIEPTSTGCVVYLNTLEENPADFVATFKTRLPATYVGKEVPLAVNTRKLHLFDQKTGRSILYS